MGSGANITESGKWVDWYYKSISTYRSGAIEQCKVGPGMSETTERPRSSNIWPYRHIALRWRPRWEESPGRLRGSLPGAPPTAR